MSSLKLLVNSPKVITATNWLLLLLFLWLTTQFVWSFWPQSTPTQDVSTPTNSTAPQFNLNRVLSANLFGTPDQAEEAPAQITAPVTRLNLKLRGVYSSEETYASAMIEHNRTQEVYRIGSKLPGAAGLELYRVLPDRIIMSRNGKYETLYIEDFDGSSGSNRRQPTVINANPITPDPAMTNAAEAQSTDRSLIDRRRDDTVTQQIAQMREMLADPTALNQLVNFTPAIEDQEFKGFRISPGQNRALFSRLGLRRNDVVTAINGITLDDPDAIFTILDQMGTAEEITLSLMRGQEEKTVIFSASPQ